MDRQRRKIVVGERTDDSPDTVLLTDVVGTGTEGLFTADGQAAGVHEITEELPACVSERLAPSQVKYSTSPTSRNLEILKALLLGDHINGLAGWHTPSQALDATLLEVRDSIRPMGDDRDRVRRRNECTLAINHVPVTITIAGSPKRDIVLLNSLDEGVRVGEVRIRVSSTKIGQRNAVLDRRLGKTELLEEDGLGVRTGDAMKTVEEDLEVLGVFVQEFLDQREVEDLLEQGHVISDGVDDGDFGRSIREISGFGKVDLHVRNDGIRCSVREASKEPKGRTGGCSITL